MICEVMPANVELQGQFRAATGLAGARQDSNLQHPSASTFRGAVESPESAHGRLDRTGQADQDKASRQLEGSPDGGISVAAPSL
jgi:hypothetical protein